MATRIFLLAVCIALLSFPTYAETYTAKVIGITDSDTITVLRDGNQQVKIRLASIDAPEKGQPYGKAAKRFLGDLIFGETIKVKVTTRDRYGRSVAWLYLKDLCINEKMVAAGYAWQYKKYSDDRTLARLEQEARIDRRGLW